MSDQKYVVCVERDTMEVWPDCRPIVWEQYLDQGDADYASVKARAEKIGNKYGEAKIARLVFEGEEGVEA